MLYVAVSLWPSMARATRVMELRAEQLMSSVNEIKNSLALTPNQQTLWQQVSLKTRALMNTRQLRREKLQAGLKTRLNTAETDLRDLAVLIDEEANAAANEDKQLRDLWLTVNDALDDRQRTIVVQFLLDQLDRADDEGRGARTGRSDGSLGGMGRQRPGGMGSPRF